MKKLDISTTCRWWISSVVCNVNSLAFGVLSQKKYWGSTSNLLTSSQCRCAEGGMQRVSSAMNYRVPFSNKDQTTRRFSSSFKLHSTFAPSRNLNEEIESSSCQPDNRDSKLVSDVVILADHEEFIRPERDPRKYRAIRLKNNLQVLIVSDQMTSGVGIEAGSVHVKSGHFDDTIPGLAHFHEHMLFLGTTKYPEEDDYESFLSQFGGFSNAYTDMEDTNYYFSVTTDASECIDKTSDALHGALDRLAQFFISPTFDRDAVDRELRAIDSEYRNGKTSDSWRNFQLLKSLSNPKHPFSNFGCGNYETLTSKGLDNLLNELEKFWSLYYKTFNLRLTIVGHGSLDALQQTVVETFGQLPYSEGKLRHTRDLPGQIFTREGAVYGVDAFDKDAQMGKVRKVIPITETRNVKVYFKTPPTSDSKLKRSKPYAAISHVLGHEGPGSLHALLNEMDYISSLSSGPAVDTSDFSLFQISISLAPKGLENQQKVLDLIFQWIYLVRQNEAKMSQFHDELKQLSSVNFRFRENGDPTDFCSTVSELLFDEELNPARVLTASSDTSEYDPDIAQEFLRRLTPDNCMITILSSDLDDSQGEWKTEKWYGAKYQEESISLEQLEAWDTPASVDSRLKLPELNKYIPHDFSLRCADEANAIESAQSTEAEITVPPKLVSDTASLRLWHKMDRYWRVPKAFVKVALLTPSIYSTPRSMTLNRVYQRMLNDDLNSFVYDAAVAGCNYRVNCTPQGYRLSVRGYSEKLLFLLETLTSRMLSLIEQMKTGDPVLQAKFDKAKENLLRETKNYRLDPPYEVASYNGRLFMEESVWYLDNYVDLMEGMEAKRHPLTMYECATAAEECLTGSIKCEALCMGNIDEKEASRVSSILQDRFLMNSRILSEVEVPRFRSMMLPSREEAERIFGPEVNERSMPLVYQELAYTESEENNAVELVLQAGSEFELGYEGLAIMDLIAHIAINSAFGQLRTKEQLGYIVSVFPRKTAGGSWGMSIVVQSSVALPEILEERCEAWLELYRKELEEMDPEDVAREASAVVAQLLERDTKMSQEVSRVWGEILSTEGLVDRLRTPQFGRINLLVQELTVVDESENEKKSPKALKRRVLEFFDLHFHRDSPERRALSTRVYSHQSKAKYESFLGKPGILSTYSDMRYVKQFLRSLPSVPYWRIESPTGPSQTRNIARQIIFK